MNYNAESELDVYFNTSVNHIYKTTYINSGWNGWTDMGSSFNSDPYITTNSNNDLQVYAKDTSNYIETRYWSYSGQTWSGWASLNAPTMKSSPFAYLYGTELDVLATGNSDGKTYKDSNNNGWGGISVLN